MSISPIGQQIPQWTLGERLRKARRTAGLTAADMADALGFRAKRTVERYEADDLIPRSSTVTAWAVACHVDHEWLVYGEAGPPPGAGSVLDRRGLLRGRDSNSQPTGHVSWLRVVA